MKSQIRNVCFRTIDNEDWNVNFLENRYKLFLERPNRFRKPVRSVTQSRETLRSGVEFISNLFLQYLKIVY